MAREVLPDGIYADVAGLCNVSSLDQIQEQSWSLNPGRYVGTSASGEDDIDFLVRIAALREDFALLSAEAELLMEKVTVNFDKW